MAIVLGRYGRRAGYGGARATEYGLGGPGRTISSPTQLSNLSAWYKADAGITLGTTLLAAGTTPPVVTISGTLTQSTGLYIQIDGAGVLGVATFKWSVDNGATFQATGVLTAASVSLGATGISAAFAVGTYVTDNIYQATVATWADQTGLGVVRDLVGSTAAKQPLMITSARNGLPGLRFNGTSNEMNTGTYTRSTPQSLFIAFKPITMTGGGAKDILMDGTNIGEAFVQVTTSSTSLEGVLNAVVPVCTAGVYDFATFVFSSSLGRIRGHGNEKVAPGNTSGNTTGFTLGNFTGGSRWANFEVVELINYNTAEMSIAKIKSVENYLRTKYLL